MNRYRSSSKELSALAAGFTLVELMISIALVLLLMLGINRVFQVTGEAIGTNAAVSTGVRDARAAQAVFAGDFVAYAADSPALIIRSERVSAFRNRQDALGDKDWDGTTATELGKRTIDLDGDGTEGNSLGESTPAGIYNHRSHRVDHLSFFARGLFRRQTGGGIDASNNELNDYISSMTGTEAWISYGHIRRPDERKPM